MKIAHLVPLKANNQLDGKKHQVSTSLNLNKQQLDSDKSEPTSWQALPSIGQMRRAVARKVISRGFAYDLPPDKQSTSVSGIYRTDLAKIFEERRQVVSNQSEPQFSSNLLNSNSEQVVNQYVRSAPSAGAVGRAWSRRMNVARLRSAMSGPLHHETSWPEADRLREMANQIIASNPEADEHQSMTVLDAAIHRNGDNTPASAATPASAFFDRINDGRSQMSIRSTEAQPNKASRFESYESLKNFKVPSLRPLPSDGCTTYLSQQKAQEVWKWILNNEEQTEFSFFLELCS